MGGLYSNQLYVAKPSEFKLKNAKAEVSFNRFCFDFISMLGKNILTKNSKDFGVILRKIFSSMTYYTSKGIMFLQPHLIKSEFPIQKPEMTRSYVISS